MLPDPFSKKQKIEALEQCASAQDVLNKTYEVLGNPILTHNMEYKLLFYSQNVVCDDPIWKEYIANGFASAETIAFFAEEQFIEMATNTNSVTMMCSDKLKHDRIFGKLFGNEGIQIGCACMVEYNKPFSQDDIDIFSAVCDIFASKISEEKEFQEYAHMYNKRMIGTLIEATYEDKQLYAPHLANIYNALESKLYIMVADISACGLKLSPSDYVQRLKTINGNYKYYEYGDEIIIIFSARKNKLSVEKDIPELNNLFLSDGVYAGVSGPFDNLFNLNQYYAKAKSALSAGKKKDGKNRIFI